jgi:hypothetical protein
MKSAVTKRLAGLMLGAIVLLTPAGADEWDQGSDPDAGPATDNALFHGSEQVHDLAVQPGPAADQDWYLTSVRPFSSYQFVVDGFTGDLDLGPTDLQRLNASEVVQQSAIVLDGGGALSMSWFQAGAPEETSFVRVSGAACGVSCTLPDTYRARFFETTYTVPRFNNSGSQATVLMVQNATDRTCSAQLFFMDDVGGLVGSAVLSLGPHQLQVFATASIVAGQSGSVRVAHLCGYGGLSGKAVSVEPATGFTFDTPMLHRPH